MTEHVNELQWYDKFRDWVSRQADDQAVQPELYQFLEKPIRLQGAHDEPLFLNVRLIERPGQRTRNRVRFWFDVSRVEREYNTPKVVNAESVAENASFLAMSTKNLDGTILCYAFSALNSLDQNVSNLQDFVRAHFETANSRGTIDRDA